MAGRMRKRTKGKLPASGFGNAMKGFHAPQRDDSVRQRKKIKLNDYKDQSHQAKENQQ